MYALTDTQNTHRDSSQMKQLILPQKTAKRTRKSNITTHHIENWTVRESIEPFPEQENKLKIYQWTIDDVCLFFERVIGVNCYTPIIKEHLIDGFALLLLKEEHLFNTFKMPKQSRQKILDEIRLLHM